MCCLRNIAMCDYQESVTTETDAGQSYPHVLLCFAGDTESWSPVTKVELISVTIHIEAC